MKRPSAFLDRLMSLAHMFSVSIGLAKPRPPEHGSRGVPERAVREAVRQVDVIAAPAQQLPPSPPPIAAPVSPPAPATVPATAARADSRARRADEDPPEEMGGSSLVAAARRRERARCAAIMTSELGLKHPKVAFALAFHTTQSVADALATLEGLGAGAFSHLAEIGLQGGASRYRAGRPH